MVKYCISDVIMKDLTPFVRLCVWTPSVGFPRLSGQLDDQRVCEDIPAPYFSRT